jgi:hypothetical protein
VPVFRSAFDSLKSVFLWLRQDGLGYFRLGCVGQGYLFVHLYIHSLTYQYWVTVKELALSTFYRKQSIIAIAKILTRSFLVYVVKFV